MKPVVSVVIPAYNAAWCIRDALRSVARQTLTEAEVIVVDDGSTDGTAEITKEAFREEGLRDAVVVSQPNGRLGAARNRGIREVRTPFTAFLDADDLWDPPKLERSLAVFKEDSAVGLVCHDERATQNGRTVRTNRYGPWRTDMYEHLLFEDNCLSPSAVTVRTDLLRQVGGFSEEPRFHSIEDYDLWMRLSKITTFEFMPDVLGTQRVFDTSLSAKIDYNLNNTLAVLDRHFAEYFAGRSISSRDQRRIDRRKSVVFRRAARQAQQCRNWRAARKYAKTALHLYPFRSKTLILASLVGLRLPR